MFRFAAVLALVVVSHCVASTQNVPTSSSQALAYAAQSISALTSGSAVNDITLTGTATWTAGSDTETGTVTLMARGTGESRIDLVLLSGTRTEIRDASTGTALGKWIAPTGTSGKFALHNCQTDPSWFFPALGSLAGGSNVVFSYVGQETRNGETVQHIQSYVYQSPQSISSGSSFALLQLSTLDFYLDATTLLPSAVSFNVHPDNDAGTNIPVEVDFSNYQAINGINIPMHIQKYVQGTLTIDVIVSGFTLNTGLTLSNFSIN